MREIAENSDFSHGVLHYYFSDKVDLTTCSVRLYKARCVTRYDRVIAEATGYPELPTAASRSSVRRCATKRTCTGLWSAGDG